MTAIGVYQIVFFFLVILALTKPVGAFMTRVFQGERTFLHPLLRPLERLIYRLSGIREEVEQHWTQYAGAVLAVSVAKFAFTYLIQRLQGFLPLNPQGFSTANAAQGATTMTPDLAFNTAVSFMTNTNWQSYVRRDDDELLRADGGADRAELRVGRRRDRDRHRADPRLRAAGHEDDRKLLGRFHARDRLHPAADVARRRAHLCVAGRDSELRRRTRR